MYRLVACFGVQPDASAAAYKRLSNAEKEVRDAAKEMKIAWAGPEDPAPLQPPQRMCESTAICLAHGKCLIKSYRDQVCTQCIPTLVTRDSCCEADFMLKDPELLAAHARNDLDAWKARLKHKPSCRDLKNIFYDTSTFSADTINTVLDNNYYTYPVFRPYIQKMQSHFLTELKSHASTLRDSTENLSYYTAQLASAETWLTTAHTHMVAITKAFYVELEKAIPLPPTTMDRDLRAAATNNLVSLQCSENTAAAFLRGQIVYYVNAIEWMQRQDSVRTGEGYLPPRADIGLHVEIPPFHRYSQPYLPHSIPQIHARIKDNKSKISSSQGFSESITPLVDAIGKKFLL
jgi:hypothetical protein